MQAQAVEPLARAQLCISARHVEARPESQQGTMTAKLKQCGNRRDLQQGRLLHSTAIQSGCHKNIYVANTLISMYSKCGIMQEARDVFEKTIQRDVVSWNALILGYVENGESSVAFNLFNTMNCTPNRITFVAALKACADNSQKLALVHRQATELGLEKDIIVANTLVDMYSKGGDMLRARDVFDGMIHRDVVSWTALIHGYVENGQSLIALCVFNSMDCSPDRVTFVTALKACAGLGKSENVAAVHSQAREFGFDKDVTVANTLIEVYSRCGGMLQARGVFDRMTHRNVVSSNALILGYVENGESSAALDVFNNMECSPDHVTFLAALKACASDLQKGMAVHKQARELGFDKDLTVANMLVELYSKCGDMLHARGVFDGMTQKNAVSWTCLIRGYVENGESLAALDVFNSMDCSPGRVAFIAALKACTRLENKLVFLHKIHRRSRQLGFDKDVVVGSSLVDMYSKCRDMVSARDVFDGMTHRSVVSWNSLILGYVENGENSMALDVFKSMDCPPDRVTFVAALKACTSSVCLRTVHRQARALGFERDLTVASTLVDMYSKCGDMLRARRAFDATVSRDIVSWTSLIHGYVENGEYSEALDLFHRMDCAPDPAAFVAALKACGGLGASEGVQRIHDRVLELGMERNGMVASCLVDCYGKCGDMDAAEAVFHRMAFRNVVCWNALLGGYSLLGDTSRVFSVVERMQECGVQMNGVTFLIILTVCNHVGMVEEGFNWFESMSKYGVSPSVEHYSCMVDMLGRANRLQEALSLVRNMPVEANSVVWASLLAACGNAGIAEVAFSSLVTLDKGNVPAAYVLMRNIYERSGMQQEAASWL